MFDEALSALVLSVLTAVRGTSVSSSVADNISQPCTTECNNIAAPHHSVMRDIFCGGLASTLGLWPHPAYWSMHNAPFPIGFPHTERRGRMWRLWLSNHAFSMLCRIERIHFIDIVRGKMTLTRGTGLSTRFQVNLMPYKPILGQQWRRLFRDHIRKFHH